MPHPRPSLRPRRPAQGTSLPRLEPGVIEGARAQWSASRGLGAGTSRAWLAEYVWGADWGQLLKGADPRHVGQAVARLSAAQCVELARLHRVVTGHAPAGYSPGYRAQAGRLDQSSSFGRLRLLLEEQAAVLYTFRLERIPGLAALALTDPCRIFDADTLSAVEAVLLPLLPVLHRLWLEVGADRILHAHAICPRTAALDELVGATTDPKAAVLVTSWDGLGPEPRPVLGYSVKGALPRGQRVAFAMRLEFEGRRIAAQAAVFALGGAALPRTARMTHWSHLNRLEREMRARRRREGKRDRRQARRAATVERALADRQWRDTARRVAEARAGRGLVSCSTLLVLVVPVTRAHRATLRQVPVEREGRSRSPPGRWRRPAGSRATTP